MDSMKKIPYGLTDFNRIQCENYYYVDKTRFIPLLEQAANFLFLIRPHRFGKSLFLSILEDYYDVARKDTFEEIFKNTYILTNYSQDRNTLPWMIDVLIP